MSLYYTNDHEWIKQDGNEVTIGISNHAQEQLGELVFVELPAVGDIIKKGDGFSIVESVKAASDVYAPVDGEVIAINEAVVATPKLVNEKAEDEGWFIKVKLSGELETAELMDKEAYQALTG